MKKMSFLKIQIFFLSAAQGAQRGLRPPTGHWLALATEPRPGAIQGDPQVRRGSSSPLSLFHAYSILSLSLSLSFCVARDLQSRILIVLCA